MKSLALLFAFAHASDLFEPTPVSLPICACATETIPNTIKPANAILFILLLPEC
jgi:hypothetical protein